jgi:hypothetical protein
MKLTRRILTAATICIFVVSLSAMGAVAQTGDLKLDPSQIENIVQRSYQYIAMYNVINKAAMAPVPTSTGGWNKIRLNTRLADANLKAIARPNNDTLYQIAMLDLRNEPVILDVPTFDSNYVLLETSAYDHYIGIPMSTRQGDYKKPQRLLFYTVRTKSYRPGDKIHGVDRYLEMSGDFVMAFHRIMPHANDPARFERIAGQIESLKVTTLSEYMGKPPKPAVDAAFPAYGKTDADVFGNNLLEVMQFIFNHTTFDPSDELDRALIAAYKPLGVEPGKAWDPTKAAKIDCAMFRQVSQNVQAANLALMGNPAHAASMMPRLFLPKGKMKLDALVLQSIVGPIGPPAVEAIFLPINTMDGKPMNALHDYLIKMTRDELPPAKAFWSFTLYDTGNGFFIPNSQNKYSIGENAGFKLNADGGIEIHVAAQKPTGVPDENWLPINRGDQDLDIVLRLYLPDPIKMKTWNKPKVVLSR